MHFTKAIPLTAAIAYASPFTAPGKIDSCVAAPNCETYVHPDTNITMIRFKAGMGPDSEWYHHNVRLVDSKHPLNLHKRQDNSPHYNSDRSTDTQAFGNVSPVDVANSMYDNCGSSSCSLTWTKDTELKGEDHVTEGGTITIMASGQWDSSDSANRGNFIEAMKAQSQPSSSFNTGVVEGPYASDNTYEDFYVGPKFVDINRYVNGNLQGFASLTITVQEDNPDPCDTAVGFLSAAGGAISGIGAGFFGAVGTLTCNAAKGNDN